MRVGTCDNFSICFGVRHTRAYRNHGTGRKGPVHSPHDGSDGR